MKILEDNMIINTLLLLLLGLTIGFLIRFFLKRKPKWQMTIVLLLTAACAFYLGYSILLILERGGSLFAKANRSDLYFALSSSLLLTSLALYIKRNLKTTIEKK